MKAHVFLLGAISVLFLYSCSLDNQGLDCSLRASLSTTRNAGSEAKILIEGPDGNLLSGSSVSIDNGDGTLSLLDFDFSKGGYIGSFPPSSTGSYTIVARSLLFPDPLELVVPHSIMAVAPVVDTLKSSIAEEDSVRNVFAGDRLEKNGIITIAWAAVESATVYHIEISFGQRTVMAASSATTLFTVPAGSLSDSGMYTLRVSAQYLAGDPLFVSDSYWSFSEYKGSSVMFEVE